MPTDVARLKTYLGLTGATSVDDDAMLDAVEAANQFVTRLRPDWTATVPWPADADQAATVEAARLYGRRGSVQGVAAFADIGVSLLPRLDPEVRSLLQLGEYQESTIA